MDCHLMMCEIICSSGTRLGFRINPEWHMGRIECSRDVIRFAGIGRRFEQSTLDAISHANESLYLIRSGTA